MIRARPSKARPSTRDPRRVSRRGRNLPRRRCISLASVVLEVRRHCHGHFSPSAHYDDSMAFHSTLSCPVILVTDSTALFGQGLLYGTNWDSLADRIAKNVLSWVLPEVVLKEAARQLRNELVTHTQALEKSLRQAERTFKRLNAHLDHDLEKQIESARELADGVEEALRARVSDIGGEIREVATVSFSRLMKWELAGRKPFKANGSAGYRDAAIWATVLDLINESGPDSFLVFATGNTTDFCEGNDLHPQLQRDLLDLGRDGQVLYANGLSSGVKVAMALDTEHSLTTSEIQLTDVLAKDAESLVRASVEEVCGGLLLTEIGKTETHESSGGFSWIDSSLRHPTYLELEPDLNGAEYDLVERYGGETELWQAKVDVQGTISGYMASADFADSIDAVSIIDGDPAEDAEIEVGFDFAGEAIFSVVVSPGTGSTSFEELLSIQTDPW